MQQKSYELIFVAQQKSILGAKRVGRKEGRKRDRKINR